MKFLRILGGHRIAVLVVLYALVLTLTLWLAYQLRFDFSIPDQQKAVFPLIALGVVCIKMVFLLAFRQYTGLWSYFSTPELLRLFYGLSGASAVIGIFSWQLGSQAAPPRSVVLIDLGFSFLLLSMIRLGFRLVRERYMGPNGRHRRRARRVGIIGAGDAGAILARELSIKRGLGLQPIAFFDDNRAKWNSRVHDIPVVGPPEMLLNGKGNMGLEEVIIAMPSAPARRIAEVVKILQQARLKFETVPSLDQLATGQVKVSQLRSVDIQDLLGREPVKLEAENIRLYLKEKIVMVTGAGGSIGSELCRQIASYSPDRLLLVEQSEAALFMIEQELIEHGYGSALLPLVADVLDQQRMRYIFERFTPQVVFHAAAHKHVPMMENQPGEAFQNNTLGTARIAELALEYAVDRFVLISTDKAINPTNVMGATKRLAEIYIQSLHASNKGKTRFMAVRFGNVLGSSGSVLPIFRKQIAAGGPVRVTHPDVTRYFMTIPEAVGLVLQTGALGSGGEIFVLDMGKPIRIVDLARQLIELSGFKPDEDIEIVFTGLRPGEKLFEELSYQRENLTTTDHPRILRFVTQPPPLETVQCTLDQLAAQIHRVERTQFKLMLKQAVPEYQPYLT